MKAARQGRKGGAVGLPTAVLGPVVQEVPEDSIYRHQEITRAHSDAVMAIVMDDGVIYTASRDRLLKRWTAKRNPTGRVELEASLEVPLGEVCWCLISAGEWIFCGLGDGKIKSFSKTGQQADLQAHTKRVSCLLIHQHVLLSGGSDSSVCCWQMTPGSSSFTCTHKLSRDLPGAVTCMSVLNEKLWVGGSSGLSIVDLATLQAQASLPPAKFVSGLLQFDGHMIVVYADGAVCIFDANGIQKHQQPPLPSGPVLCVAGLESGPRVLCGHAKGQVSSITLPMFQLKKYWQALERCKVTTMCTAGHDGIFLLGAENGNLQIWQRIEAPGSDI